MSEKEPRSVRLNKTHRQDMVDAVMGEWEKQNPPPAQNEHRALLEIVAGLLVGTAAYKRTVRLSAVMEADDWRHVDRESRVNVQMQNSDGENLSNFHVQFPYTLALELGLTVAPESQCSYRGCGDDSPLLLVAPTADLDADNPSRVRLATFVESRYPTVVIDRNHPAMKRRRDNKRARSQWEDERNRLRCETADLLDQFGSTKQLREHWPDMVPYLPPHIADPEQAVRLPVMATSRLSERLGIK